MSAVEAEGAREQELTDAKPSDTTAEQPPPSTEEQQPAMGETGNSMAAGDEKQEEGTGMQ